MSSYSWISKQKHGIPSPENDDINKIMNHKYMYEHAANTQNEIKKQKELKKITKVLPKMPTKASKLRDDYLKNIRNEISNQINDEHKAEWKLRQFLGVGPSEDIVKSIKHVRRRQNKSIIPKMPENPHMNTTQGQELPNIDEKKSEGVEKQSQGSQYSRIDKKAKDKLLSEYFSEKRSMSSRRSNH